MPKHYFVFKRTTTRVELCLIESKDYLDDTIVDLISIIHIIYIVYFFAIN